MMTSDPTGFLRRLIAMSRAAADLLMPRHCLICGTRLMGSEEQLCTRCASSLPRLNDVAAPYDNPTSRRLWGKVEAERVAAGYEYVPHGVVSLLIYKLKYDSRPEIGEWIGEALASYASEHAFFDGIDAIVPLPLHSSRQKERGYNQSEMFARGLARVTGIAIDASLMKRVRKTMTQTLLAPSQRASNMDGAFDVIFPERAEGKHLLLVDDILTSGASAASGILQLQKAGADKVSVLTIARTRL